MKSKHLFYNLNTEYTWLSKSIVSLFNFGDNCIKELLLYSVLKSLLYKYRNWHTEVRKLFKVKQWVRDKTSIYTRFFCIRFYKYFHFMIYSVIEMKMKMPEWELSAFQLMWKKTPYMNKIIQIYIILSTKIAVDNI